MARSQLDRCVANSNPMSLSDPIPSQRVEFPTLVVAFVIFTGFVSTTLSFDSMPLWIAAPLCGVLLAWYGSLQHETIHGHPSPWASFNTLLGWAPLSLWIPYARYRGTHLEHHANQGHHLTEIPYDPESFYLPRGSVARFGPLRHALHQANCTLLGRVVIGPAIAVLGFWSSDARAILAGDRRRLIIWARHALGAAVVLWWVVAVCHISVGVYAALVVYPSIALTHLRSYVEHYADVDPRRRTRVVESNPLWSLLFLNNNLHIAHHAQPQTPWYRLPRAWRDMRPARGERHLIFSGYRDVLRRYLVRPYITVEHPMSGGRRQS